MIVATEVQHVLPLFGLSVTTQQAADISDIYTVERPRMTLEQLTGLILRLPDLPWLDDDTNATKELTVSTLISHLDTMYFVATFEHDR